MKSLERVVSLNLLQNPPIVAARGERKHVRVHAVAWFLALTLSSVKSILQHKEYRDEKGREGEEEGRHEPLLQPHLNDVKIIVTT